MAKKTPYAEIAKEKSTQLGPGSVTSTEDKALRTLLKAAGLSGKVTTRANISTKEATAKTLPTIDTQQWAQIQKAAKSKAATIKADKSANTSASTADTLEREIATGPYSKILGAVTQEFQPAQQAATAAASGSLTAPATQGAWAEALTALAGTPATVGGTASAWLGQNLATAAKTTAPLTQAMSNYGAAMTNEAQPILSNLTALGQGLTLEQSTAPESAWLSALGSHITSNLSYYGTIPTAAVTSLPSGVAKALQESGGYGGGSSGVIPVSSLTTKGSTAKATGTTGLGGTALTGEGSIPGSSSAPGQ